jgi:hypothetical protein
LPDPPTTEKPETEAQAGTDSSKAEKEKKQPKKDKKVIPLTT